MKVTFYESPTPHLLLENVFDSNSLDLIWNELNFLTPKLKGPEITGSAKDENREILKLNKGLFLNSLYTHPGISDIVRLTENVIFNTNVINQWKLKWTKQLYENTNWNCTLLSYYENSDYYKPHFDVSVFTSLFWFWKTPKKFLGGNLTLNNYNYVVECRNNCGIIFLSSEIHSVDSISMNVQDLNSNSGRYCVTNFIGLGKPDKQNTPL